MKRAARDPRLLTAADQLATASRTAQRTRNSGDFAVTVKCLVIEGRMVELSPAGALIVAEALRKAAEEW
jgi:hypothetical protein